MKLKKILFFGIVGCSLLINACGNSNNTGTGGIQNTAQGPMAANGHGTGVQGPAGYPLEGKWSVWTSQSYCEPQGSSSYTTDSTYFQQAYYVFQGNTGEFDDYTQNQGWEFIQFTISYGPNNTITLSGFQPPQCAPVNSSNYSTSNCGNSSTPPSNPITYQYVLSGQSLSGQQPLTMANLQLISVSSNSSGYGAYGSPNQGQVQGSPGNGSSSSTTTISQLPPAATDDVTCGYNFSSPMESDLYLN